MGNEELRGGVSHPVSQLHFSTMQKPQEIGCATEPCLRRADMVYFVLCLFSYNIPLKRESTNELINQGTLFGTTVVVSHSLHEIHIFKDMGYVFLWPLCSLEASGNGAKRGATSRS